MIVFLDTGILGLLANPNKKGETADIIICAQYKLLEKEYPGRYIVIATTNVKHLSRFTEAKEWQEIEF